LKNLRTISERVLSGEILKEKLSTANLERICTYYGLLAKRGNLYDILFTQENEKVTLDGDEINTKDLMWFTLMDHTYARAWYWKPNGKATTDTSVNHAVPLAFKGARRVFNKSYMSWFTNGIECDIFLPQGLNSYRISEDGSVEEEKEDQLRRGGKAGLIHLYNNQIDFPDNIIRILREEIPNYATTAKPKKVKLDANHFNIWNNSSHLIRCMIIQGWCWYGASRHSDQITDYKDWDNFSPSIDHMPRSHTIPNAFLNFTGTKN
jgi:hypothetical protein